MAISPAFMDEIRSRVSLSSVIGRRVKIIRAGREWKACCPFHQEKTPSFTINDEKGFYHCFGCGAHGDVIRFMTDHERLGFREAVEQLAQLAGLEMPRDSREDAQEAARRGGLVETMAAAAEWFATQLHGVQGGMARDYLARRGIGSQAVARFALGFAPDDRQRLRPALNSHGMDRLVEAGLLIAPEGGGAPYDRFRGRLMFPIRDTRGRVIAFGGRILGDGEPKYLNSPDTPLFDKGRTLFNLDQAGPVSRKSGRMIVVEGYMDVIALDQAGIGDAVAPLGTALTENHLSMLWRIVDTPLLCFDGDTAGQRAAIRAALRALPLLKPGKSLGFITLPAGQDPDDLIRSGGSSVFERLAGEAEPLVERIWRSELAAARLDTPEQRAGLQARLRDHARTIGDEDVRRAYESAFRERFYAHFRGGSARSNAPQPVIRSGPSSRRPADATLRAILAGVIEHPMLAVAQGERLARLSIGDPGLARLREIIVDAAMRDPNLDKRTLDNNLAAAGVGALAEEVRRSNRLAFSFTRRDCDDDRAGRDLATVLEALSSRLAVDAALTGATSRFRITLADEDYAEQQRLLGERNALDARLRSLARSED